MIIAICKKLRMLYLFRVFCLELFYSMDECKTYLTLKGNLLYIFYFKNNLNNKFSKLTITMTLSLQSLTKKWCYTCTLHKHYSVFLIFSYKNNRKIFLYFRDTHYSNLDYDVLRRNLLKNIILPTHSHNSTILFEK